MSKLKLYFHIVWATQGRQPWINPAREAAMYRCILGLIPSDYEVLAINGMPDHVHILFKTGPQIDVSAMMKRVKGVSSSMANDMTEHAERFRWQEGYYAATVTPSHVPKVLSYVKGQKEHHRAHTIHAAWEETDDDID